MTLANPINGSSPKGTNGSYPFPRTPPQKLIDHLRALTHAVEKQGKVLANLSEELTQQSAAQTDMGTTLRVLFQRMDCLDEFARQQKVLTDQHYFEHVVMPMFRRLSGEIDLAGDYLASFEGASSTPIDLLQALRDQLIELLGEYGIRKLHADPGAIFEPKWMKPGKIVLTTNKSEDKQIVSTMRCGFARGELILRPATVCMLKFENVSGQLF